MVRVSKELIAFLNSSSCSLVTIGFASSLTVQPPETEDSAEELSDLESAGDELDGSWQTVEITEGAVLEDELKTALDGVMTKEYVPIAVLGTQVVSGTNYVLLVQEKEGDKPVNYVVELSVDAEGKAELTKEAVFDLNYYLSIY